MGDRPPAASEPILNRLIVSPSCPEDAIALASNLRQADQDEIAAASGLSPLMALQQGLEVTDDPYTVTRAGQPLAIFGVAPMGGTVGAPWMLASDGIRAHYREFLRRSREEFERIREPYTYLFNYSDARNTLANDWLRWLGFTFIRVEPYGVAQLPFWRFEYAA